MASEQSSSADDRRQEYLLGNLTPPLIRARRKGGKLERRVKDSDDRGNEDSTSTVSSDKLKLQPLRHPGSDLAGEMIPHQVGSHVVDARTAATTKTETRSTTNKNDNSVHVIHQNIQNNYHLNNPLANTGESESSGRPPSDPCDTDGSIPSPRSTANFTAGEPSSTAANTASSAVVGLTAMVVHLVTISTQCITLSLRFCASTMATYFFRLAWAPLLSSTLSLALTIGCIVSVLVAGIWMMSRLLELIWALPASSYGLAYSTAGWLAGWLLPQWTHPFVAASVRMNTDAFNNFHNGYRHGDGNGNGNDNNNGDDQMIGNPSGSLTLTLTVTATTSETLAPIIPDNVVPWDYSLNRAMRNLERIIDSTSESSSNHGNKDHVPSLYRRAQGTSNWAQKFRLTIEGQLQQEKSTGDNLLAVMLGAESVNGSEALAARQQREIAALSMGRRAMVTSILKSKGTKATLLRFWAKLMGADSKNASSSSATRVGTAATATATTTAAQLAQLVEPRLLHSHEVIDDWLRQLDTMLELSKAARQGWAVAASERPALGQVILEAQAIQKDACRLSKSLRAAFKEQHQAKKGHNRGTGAPPRPIGQTPEYSALSHGNTLSQVACEMLIPYRRLTKRMESAREEELKELGKIQSKIRARRVGLSEMAGVWGWDWDSEADRAIWEAWLNQGGAANSDIHGKELSPERIQESKKEIVGWLKGWREKTEAAWGRSRP